MIKRSKYLSVTNLRARGVGHNMAKALGGWNCVPVHTRISRFLVTNVQKIVILEI